MESASTGGLWSKEKAVGFSEPAPYREMEQKNSTAYPPYALTFYLFQN